MIALSHSVQSPGSEWRSLWSVHQHLGSDLKETTPYTSATTTVNKTAEVNSFFKPSVFILCQLWNLFLTSRTGILFGRGNNTYTHCLVIIVKEMVMRHSYAYSYAYSNTFRVSTDERKNCLALLVTSLYLEDFKGVSWIFIEPIKQWINIRFLKGENMAELSVERLLLKSTHTNIANVYCSW